MTTTRGRSPGSPRQTPEIPGLAEIELRPPPLRPGLVRRDRLIERLRTETDARVCAIVAPAGYGKTVLMAQWLEAETRPTAWLTLDRTDDDPASLLSHIAGALRNAGLLKSNGAPVHFTSGQAISHGVPRLVRALQPALDGGILFLDHFDALRKRAAIDVIGALLYQLEGRLQIVVASRANLQLPIAPLRAQGAVFEVASEDLAFDGREAALLLDSIGIEARYDIDELMVRTEGWPVGVYLAGLAMQVGSDSAQALVVGGDDLWIAEYLRSEILDHLSEAQVTFLTRTSILDQLSGQLCDAVLETTGSGRMLEVLEQSNLLITRLDRTREWHRYHHMFQDLLQAELALREPEGLRGLHTRAAEWFEAHGMPELAVHHAQAAGDGGRVARIVEDIGRIVYAQGRSDTLFDWLEWLESTGEIRSHPGAVAIGWLASALSGDTLGVERWMSVDEPMHPVALLARAIQTRSGTMATIEDARSARNALPPGSGFLPAAYVIEGLGTLWNGETERADSLFAEAIALSEPLMATATAAVALAERAVIAIEAGDWGRAEELGSSSMRWIRDFGLGGYTTSALGLVVAGRIARQRNDISKARALLAQAASLRPRLNGTMPGLSVQVHLEMAVSYLEVSDTAGARLVLRGAEDIVIQRPDLGLLPGRIEEIKKGLNPAPGTIGPSALTNAELRLLPLLATHLSFPEIGERLYVSRHTVKTQAMSIYRKLGSSSRSEAVQAARETGLLGV